MGIEEAFRVDFEWRAANDPAFKRSPYATLEDFLKRARMTPPHGYIGAARAIVERPDLTERVRGITAPILLMSGELDGFHPCALRDHTLIPDSRLVIRKGCAHGYKWRPESWLAEAEAFLSDVEAGRQVAGRCEV
jgi:pimeloyl-ACP methyl ester carboxylesterase